MRFLQEELTVKEADLAPDAPLFSSGLIDSFSLVSLLSFLETEGGFMIDPVDVNLENFDTIERILAYAAGQSAALGQEAAAS
ncbi:acyl carrier protein [Phenylobacterium deserti]|nr:acyl carrier protein [Phenylobacterium deserti]